MPGQTWKWAMSLGLSLLTVLSGLLFLRQARGYQTLDAETVQAARIRTTLETRLAGAESEAARSARWSGLAARLAQAGLGNATLVTPVEINQVLPGRDLDRVLDSVDAACRAATGCRFRPLSLRLERSAVPAPGPETAASGQNTAAPGDEFHLSLRGRMIFLTPAPGGGL